MIVATWVGISVLIVLSIVGWIFAYNRYSRNEAAHIGELKGTVDGLVSMIQSFEKRIESLERRIDDFITGHS